MLLDVELQHISWGFQKQSKVKTNMAEAGKKCDCAAAYVYKPETDGALIAAELAKLKSGQWVLADDHRSLTRHMVCKDFMSAISFINAAASVAEEMGHHPDLHLTKYKCIDIHVYTRSADGLTGLDFQLAALLDQIEVKYSAAWLKRVNETK